MIQEQLFKGRDRRSKGWFWMDNDYLNGYAKLFGATGTAIYLSLCRHANSETQQCFPAESTIAEELHITSRTVRKYIKLFEKSCLISVSREWDNATKRRKNNVYTLLDKVEWKKPEEIISYGKSRGNKKQKPEEIKDTSHGKQFPNKETHINKTNNKKTNIATQGVAGKKINDLIDLFKKVNPSWEKLFSNKTQRSAIERLMGKMGFEELEDLINYLPYTNAKKYAPIITTPLQLEDKLGALMAFIKKGRANEQNNIPIIL